MTEVKTCSSVLVAGHNYHAWAIKKLNKIIIIIIIIKKKTHLSTLIQGLWL